MSTPDILASSQAVVRSTQRSGTAQAISPPHLGAALVAVTLLVAVVLGADLMAHWMTGRYVHALASELFTQKNVGVALQKEAFNQPDLLLVYGSSELVRESPNHANQFFQDYPSGFTIFPVGNRGTPPLVIVESLAAVGADMRGKKVVISVSPVWFLPDDDQANYAGNFSRLQANALAFSGDLDFAFKQQAAKRLLMYPQTLEQDPLLRFALEQLADGSGIARLAYVAVFPLGMLQNAVLRLQDDAHTSAYILKHRTMNAVPAQKPASFDWPALAVQAERDYQQYADNNAFGMDNTYWRGYSDYLLSQKNTANDAQFTALVRGAQKWADLELILQELKTLGARPFIISMPINGAFSDYSGVSFSARKTYYDRLHEIAQPYGAPVFDFQDHDEDKYFLIDQSSHPSPKGWIYFDQALDTIYHWASR